MGYNPSGHASLMESIITDFFFVFPVYGDRGTGLVIHYSFFLQDRVDTFLQIVKGTLQVPIIHSVTQVT